MKFLILASLVTGSLAEGIHARNLNTITSVMSTVGDDIVGLDNAVKSFNGDPTAVFTTSTALIQALKDGKAKVDPSPGLGFFEVLGLPIPVLSLQGKGSALVKDLKAKKAVLAKAGLCEVTFIQASAINTGGQALVTSILSKVPSYLQGIAKLLTTGLAKDLADAQDAFSPANCKNAPPPPVTTKSTPTPTPTPTPTSTPPNTTTAGDTCPAAETVTVTATDSSGCY